MCRRIKFENKSVSSLICSTDQRDRNADPTEEQLSVTDAIRKFLVRNCDVITEDSTSVRTHKDSNEEDRSNH